MKHVPPGAAALVYARRGWPVLPCHTPSAGPAGCSCGRAGCPSAGKHPRVRGGLHAASTDEGQVRRWWARWPSANVAVRTGAESGLVVLDVDPARGGEASLAALVADHGAFFAGTRVVATGGGGLHLYFAHPGGRVPNDAGRRLGPGIDVRGDGGYVLAPPSLHLSGARYRPAGSCRELAPMPGWLAERLLARPERGPEARPRPDGPAAVAGAGRWGAAALAGELERLRRAAVGTRNDTLNRAAFRLGQIVAVGALDEAEVTDALLAAARAIGLGEAEAARTVRSGLTAGERAPRRPVPPLAERCLP